MTEDHLISLQPGTVIGGKYEVIKCLGSGSMGLVYACRHRDLQGQMVAVKVLFPEVANDKVAAARFRNEVLASYGVSHPNVVRAYEYLRDGDLVAYTMEYVGGGDLAERLSRTERLSITEVIRLLSQMSAGVQAIHDAGIVHRDLKPENILLTKEGNVKIADFGIARTQHGHKLTEHGGVVGTIDYVAPEYMLRSQVDWRSDIYALGILAFEMVTGEPPFRGDSVYATMTKRLKSDPEPPSKLRPECSAALDAVILRAMQRDPMQRYQSALEMFYDLQRIASAEGLSAGVAGGVFLPNQPGGASYVGPSVAAPNAGSAAYAVSSGAVDGIGAVSAATAAEESEWNRGAGQTRRVRERGVSFVGDPGVGSQSTGAAGSTSTRVLADELLNHAAETASQQGAPLVRLDPVLGPKHDFASDQWESQDQGRSSARTQQNRVADLARRYHAHGQGGSSATSGDSWSLVVAAVVGVAFGFVLLKMLWPSLLGNFGL